MSTAVNDARAALAGGGRVLLLDAESYCYFPGDESADGFWNGDAAVFEPKSGKLSRAASLDNPRFAFTMTALTDGRVLVAGGNNERGVPKSSTRIWSPATGNWADGPLMSIARQGPSSVALRDGRVLTVGGWTPSGKDTQTSEIFDPATDRWSPTGSVPWTDATEMAVTLQSGNVLAMGRDADGALRAARYDPGDGAWTDVGLPQQDLSGASPVALDDGTALFVLNGSRSVLRYDRAGGWSSAGTLTTSRSGATAALLHDGRVLVAGGAGHSRDDGGPVPVLKTAELFDPHTGRSSKAASMPLARRHGFAITLEDGSVFHGGGELDVVMDTPGCNTLVESAIRWIP